MNAGSWVGAIKPIADKILSAHDRNQAFTWLDFGTKNERVTQIDYTAPSVTTQTLRKTFSYTLVSGSYRLDTIVFTLI